MLDLTVLLLECVVCRDVTKTAHHTPTDFQPRVPTVKPRKIS